MVIDTAMTGIDPLHAVKRIGSASCRKPNGALPQEEGAG
jgi:hypothetical protein